MGCCREKRTNRVERVIQTLLIKGMVDQALALATAEGQVLVPEDWTVPSSKSVWNGLGGTSTTCQEKMNGKVKDPGSFCRSLASRVAVD
jgi:hypothetical protein